MALPSPRRAVLNAPRPARLDATAKAAASEEIADVLLYPDSQSDELGIDPLAAAEAKMVANAQKYPVEKAGGTSRKYTEL